MKKKNLILVSLSIFFLIFAIFSVSIFYKNPNNKNIIKNLKLASISIIDASVVDDNSNFHYLDSLNIKNNDEKIQIGMGVVISSDGYVLSVKHVIDRNSNPVALMYDGNILKLKEIASLPESDLILLKLLNPNEKNLNHFANIKIGSSDKIQLNEKIISITNQIKNQKNTIKKGVIISKNYSINSDEIDLSYSLNHLIQNNLNIQAGDSGGPIIDLDGRLIAINFAILEENDNTSSFAIPISSAKKLIQKTIYKK